MGGIDISLILNRQESEMCIFVLITFADNT